MAHLKVIIMDYCMLAAYRAVNWLHILRMIVRHGPFDTIREIKKYPWILELLKANRLLKRLTVGRHYHYRKAIALTIADVVRGIIELLEGIFHRSDRLVLHEDMVPPEIVRAMGLQPWMPELLGILLPMLEPGAMEQYIDEAENEGVPPDICSLPKATMGLALKDHIPPALAIVTSNLPCDGGMSSYTVIEKKTGLPTYRLDVPFSFKDDRAAHYFAEELRGMITWLEEHTPGKMDWDKLKNICDQRNVMIERELELWEMIRLRPAPMAAEAVYLSHLWAFNVFPGTESSIRLFDRLLKLAKSNLEKGNPVVVNEKSRTLLWNPPTLHAIDLFNWAEKKYGVSLIMDSMSFNRLPLIDTATEETMLLGLARTIMEGPMARHTRGPAENYFDDMYHICQSFDIDMIWVAGHIGCKNTQALNGMLRERCREWGMPLLIIDYDLSDPRIEPREGIFAQVDHFMENIMKAKEADREIKSSVKN